MLIVQLFSFQQHIISLERREVVNAGSGLSMLISGLLGIFACFIQIIQNITDLTAVGQIIIDCWSSFANLLVGLASLASLVALKLSWWQKAFFWTTFYGDQGVTQNIPGIVGRLALAVLVLVTAITKFVNVYEDSLDSDGTYYLWEYP